MFISLLSSCAATRDVPAGAAPDASQTVSLRYGWPNGLHGTMSSRVTRRRSGVPTPENYVVSGRCDFTVDAHAAGQQVRFERCTAAVDGASARLAAWRTLLEKLTTIDQSYLVNPQGELVGVEGIAEVKSALDQWLEENAATQAIDPATQQTIRDTLYSEERLTAQAADEWNAMVGIWTGADLALGETYSARIEQPAPLLPDKKIPMDVTIAATHRAPCVDGDAEARCVAMTFTSSPDAKATSELTKSLAQQLDTTGKRDAPEQQAQLERMEVHHRIVLLTEPDRLIPHRVERIKDTRVWVRSTQGQTDPIVQLEEFVHEFTYAQ